MSDVIDRTEQYYDSADADEFYFRIWGGEDIHIGLYEAGETDICEASRRSVARIAGKIAHWPEGSRFLDIGAGYGGSGRYVAKKYGFQVSNLNLSKVQNKRDREITEKQGLSGKVEVIDGNFEELPFGDNAFDIVWSQESILHSGNRFKVFREVDRVLKPGGEFIFSDPMQKPGVSKDELQPVLDRIHLETMGSVEDYKKFAAELGWETLEVELIPDQLPNHYAAVLHNLESRADEIEGKVSTEYVENMKKGLRHWIDAGKKGLLDWGILHFRKPA